MDGVLGGFANVNDADINDSEAFLKILLSERFPTGVNDRSLVALGTLSLPLCSSAPYWLTYEYFHMTSQNGVWWYWLSCNVHWIVFLELVEMVTEILFSFFLNGFSGQIFLYKRIYLTIFLICFISIIIPAKKMINLSLQSEKKKRNSLMKMHIINLNKGMVSAQGLSNYQKLTKKLTTMLSRLCISFWN